MNSFGVCYNASLFIFHPVYLGSLFYFSELGQEYGNLAHLPHEPFLTFLIALYCLCVYFVNFHSNLRFLLFLSNFQVSSLNHLFVLFLSFNGSS